MTKINPVLYEDLTYTFIYIIVRESGKDKKFILKLYIFIMGWRLFSGHYYLTVFFFLFFLYSKTGKNDRRQRYLLNFDIISGFNNHSVDDEIIPGSK